MSIISKQSIQTHFESFQSELNMFKNKIQNIHEKNQFQYLINFNVIQVEA